MKEEYGADLELGMTIRDISALVRYKDSFVPDRKTSAESEEKTKQRKT